MPNPRAPEALASPAVMLISAALFAYFGVGGHLGLPWAPQFVYTSAVTGRIVPFVPLLDWTLKASAAGFLAAALVAIARPVAGNVLYGLVGLVGALALVAVVVLDHLDAQHTTGIPSLLLLLFAAWNGFGSWSGLRAVLSGRDNSPPS
jgi:hypothetical protein